MQILLLIPLLPEESEAMASMLLLIKFPTYYGDLRSVKSGECVFIFVSISSESCFSTTNLSSATLQTAAIFSFLLFSFQLL